MSAVETELSLAAMLEANKHETQRWQHWLERPPAELLDVPQASPWRKIPANSRCPSLRWNFAMPRGSRGRRLSTTNPRLGAARMNFAIGAKAREPYRHYHSHATDVDLASVMEFPTRPSGVLRARGCKMLAHGCTGHNLPPCLRKKGHGTDWGHDFLFGDVMPQGPFRSTIHRRGVPCQ